MLTKQNVLQKSANLYLPVISSATSEVPGIRPEIIFISKSDTTIIGSILCNFVGILSLLIIGTQSVPTAKIFEEKEVKNNEKTHHKAQFR